MLGFRSAVPVAEVLLEGRPFVGRAVAVKEFVDFWIGVDGELGLNEGELVLRIGDAGSTIRIVDAFKPYVDIF